MREAGLVAAGDPRRGLRGGEARRVDLGARSDRARAASRSTRSISAFLGYAQPPTPRCCAPRSTRSSSTASRARPTSSRTATSSGSTSASSSTGSAPTPPAPSWSGRSRQTKRRLVETAARGARGGHRAVPVGNRLGDLGHAVQSYAESQGYSVVRQFVGHGTGRQMHEDPQVPNFGDAGTGKRLKRGLVIAVEPMVNAGTPDVEVLDDDWTAVTKDRSMSAHFEHTIAITDEGPWV